MTIRSKHSNLLNYFIHDRRDLSPAYVRSCETFFHNLRLNKKNKKRKKSQATSVKPQAPSARHQKNTKVFKTLQDAIDYNAKKRS